MEKEKLDLSVEKLQLRDVYVLRVDEGVVDLKLQVKDMKKKLQNHGKE